MKHAYVYYRVDPAQVATAAARIDALLNTMTRHCSQLPRRLTRCDDPATWMEIYEDISDFPVFATALDKAVRELGCTAVIQGERHLECFSAAITAP